jgi:transcriptional regulator with XRE-family HTH domain
MSDYHYSSDFYGMSDPAILKQLAQFVRQLRIRKNFKQTELAERAGMHRVTLSEFETSAQNISLLSFIELLRALNELERLSAFQIQNQISPLQMAKLEVQERQRVYSVRKKQAPKKKASLKKKK